MLSVPLSKEAGMANYQDIVYEVDDPVAIIRLNRPTKLNAFTNNTLVELRDAVETARDDPAVVGIVITGEGRGFCAGLDTEALEDTHSAGADTKSARARPKTSDEIPGPFTYLMELDKPVVAAVNGVAAGGGFALACLCDLRFASTEARFTSVFSKRGLFPEFGISWILPQIVSMGWAMDLLWTSRMVDAQEALKLGLVQHVVEPDELLEKASDYIRELGAVASPAGLRESKRLLYRHAGTDYGYAMRDADATMGKSIGSPDALEGVRSFVERRPPKFERLGRKQE
jgi:enoyl-CoA hydratase/carnithine racemase